MKVKDCIELIRRNGLTPIDVKYDGNGFVDGVGYIGCDEYPNIYLLNGKNIGSGSYRRADCYDRIMYVIYRNRGVVCQISTNIEYVCSNDLSIRMLFANVLEDANGVIKKMILDDYENDSVTKY